MMRQAPIPKLSLATAALCAGVGIAAYHYAPLSSWEPALPGLLVALSMMGAATLVRLARNAPITAPATFDEADLKRFFDVLEELSNRLLWLFYQVVFAIVLVIAAMLIVKASTPTPSDLVKAVAGPMAGLMAGILSWLLTRLAAMARGDIGFLKLQREILENALARERIKQAEKTVAAAVQFRSPGGYGRAAS
jgi:hypothetical protein